jgi:hypothetical protein
MLNRRTSSITAGQRPCPSSGTPQGDTVLLDDGSGFAICHVGPGTEAGTGTCFIKFAAAQTGSLDSLIRLLDACETFATAQGGYRADLIGVAMHRPDEPGYHRPDALVIDDWR